ncbi:polyprenyl synthetase [Candidatus Protofrankia californiensis]|uniref:Polyprenyl synthetase n=1 Tax=Candidatus Protofrankia californiensis TaxID=1839754 RepID=A0A1C3NU41_9ACTN|nr:polyprenyl synthetase [Candidatus Protofrankia californiensis]
MAISDWAAVATGQLSHADELLDWARTIMDSTLVSAVDTLPESTRRIAAYHFGWVDADGTPAAGPAGKSLRPTLVLLCAAAVGGRPEDAIDVAAAVELVHNFSLIHDDVMDRDRTRRHRPTVWAVFGVPEAILLGDALLTLAFDVLRSAPAEQAARLRCAVQQLCDGQSADVAFERRAEVSMAEYAAMARGKTAALFSCVTALGGLCGNGTTRQVEFLRRFGEELGVAFQLADDLMGIWGDPQRAGKPVCSDAKIRDRIFASPWCASKTAPRC